MTISSTRDPLPVLISHALCQFEAEYDDGREPALVVWSNVLRVLADGEISVRDFPAAAVISVRTSRVATRFAEQEGLLAIAEKAIRLTAKGQKALAHGRARVDELARRWPADLRTSLQEIVRQVDVELPHFPTGYGQGDSSFTGGNYIPPQDGPPRIPGHGEEWPVVPRNVAAVDDLPLPALLSQTLIAFTNDYDVTSEGVFGGLNGAVSFFRHVPDSGVPLAETKKAGTVSGSGRSNFERHRLVDVEDGVVLLTERGKRVRDRYPERTFEIEDDWHSRYGKRKVTTLRKQLEKLGIEGQPDFPDTNSWLRRTRRQT